MNKKYVVTILSMLFLLHSSGSVLAVTDTSGDELVAGYDITEATVLAYPPSSIQAGVKAADFIKVGLRMDDKLPGMVLMEFDVDNDTATGGNTSMCGVFDSCGGGTKLKVQPGIDIAISLVLRVQGDDAPTAWCDNCSRGGMCATRDTSCTGCDKTDCYTLSSTCTPGEPDCYVLGDNCNCNEAGCAVLNTPCVSDTPCGMGRVLGEWYATASAVGVSDRDPADRGRIEMPLPHGTDSDDEDCYTLPWARIVQAAYDALAGNPKQFDFTKATDTDNLKFQVSAWYDTNYGSTENDFFVSSGGSTCAAVVDVVPDNGMASASLGNELCYGELNGDSYVDLMDLVILAEHFGRHMFLNPCPSCKAAAPSTDTSGDGLVAGYDITEATVLAYPPSSIQAGVKAADFIKVGLRMDDKLPGMVLMEFDVDNDTATGGNTSMCGVFDSCGGGTKLKVQPGIDIAISLVLRVQGDDASTAWCDNCSGPEGWCSERDQTCSCDQANCYTAGSYCGPGDPDCYIIGDACTSGGQPCKSGDDSCRVLTDVCEASEPCGIGRIVGEWYTTAPAAGGIGGTPADRGRIEMPLPHGTDSDDEDCYTLPWARIVQAAYDALAGNPKQFDFTKATNTDNLRFQVSAWYDPDFSTTENDLINTDQLCAEVTDVVPDTGMASASLGYELCYGNFNGDRDVDGADIDILANDWGRGGYINPCPSCW